MLTDQDLTAALHDYADREAPDVAAVRAAIEHDIASGRSGRCDGSARPRAHGGRHPLVLLAVAACTLALVGLGLVITRQRQSSPQAPDRSTSVTTAAAPGLALPDTGTFPGTRLVGTFAGAGSKTVALPRYLIPRDLQLWAYLDCQGPGGVKLYSDSLGSVTTVATCGSGSVAAVIPAAQRSLRLVVAPSTRWRIAMAVQPDARTNGSVQTPAGSGLFKSLGSGRGTASLRAPAPFTTSNNPPPLGVMVELTCVGAGVTLTSTNHRFDGNYTHTCFAGHSYVFRITGPGLPTTVTVHADLHTTWRLALRNY